MFSWSCSLIGFSGNLLERACFDVELGVFRWTLGGSIDSELLS